MITQLEKYGPINSIVLSRSAESDNVYLQDEESIQENGLCELKIVDNQIMNWNDRSDYLPEILAELDGLEYYMNDFVSTGIAYLELCDRYNVKIGDNTYSCVMLNDELEVTQGLVENIHTDMPEETETDYTKADKTDRKINNVSIIVDKQQNQIELLSEKIVDISAQASGHKEVELENCSATPLYKLKITGDDSLLFPGDKKKYFTYETYEGSSIDVDIKGSSYDINNLEVKGRSTQEAIPSPDYPSEIETVKGRNLFDEDKAKKRDNYVTNASIGTGWKTITIDLAPNTQYTITRYADNVAAYPTFNLQFYLYEDTSNPLFYVNNAQNEGTLTNRTKTFTTGNSGKIYLAGLYATSDRLATLFENINIQIEKGSASTNYVPYDTIQIINTGKNLFDKSTANLGKGVSTSTGNLYNESPLFATDFIEIIPNTNYVVNGYSTSANRVYGACYDSSKNYLTNVTTNANISTFKITNASAKYIRLTGFISDIDTYQLEKGSTATEYEPYQSQTLNIDLQGNELCSIGDTKDILDISVTGDTKINKKIGKVVLDGTQTISLQSINSYNIANFLITFERNYTDTTSYSNMLSNRFIKQSRPISSTQNEGFLPTLNSATHILGVYIKISSSTASTTDELKTWLSTHNTIVYYQLATPETINLSPTKPLYLYDGINHLTNDNNADMVAKMVKSTMFLKTSDLYINQGQPNEKIFNLKIPALRELNGVKDEYNLEDTKATLTKRIGLNANLEEYILTKPQIIDLGEMTIELNEGTNILTMPSFPNNYYEVTYLLKNEYTDTFANQAQVSSMINIASDEILIKSKTEILENGDELIASINTQSTGNVLINASRLAEINANKINFNSYDFNVTTQNMKISIGQGDNKKDIINSNGVLTNLIYNGYTRGSMITGTGDYIPLGRVGGGDTKDTQRNEMIFSFKLPQNFTIQSAKIYLSHAPIKWNISGTSITGYSRNLELYKGQNIEKLKINYDVVNSIINTGGVTTDKIYDVLGTNGFSGNATTTVSTKSAELKDYIDVDKDNYFIIKDSNETAYTTNNDIFGRTGGVFGYLEIIGYSQV